jgi:transcriptional regulator with XRE-family HTH domain
LCDLRRLCALRGWTLANGGVPEGYRDLVLFLGAVALSWVTAPGSWRGEVEALAAEFTPTLRASECRSYVGTVHKRLLLARKAREGDQPDPRYRYTTARLVSDLGISATEQAAMRSLVAPEIAAERQRAHDRKYDEKRRRTAGAVPRDVYVGRAAERASAAREMAGTGIPQREIARRLGVSRQSVGAWLSAGSKMPKSLGVYMAEPSA